MASGKEELGNAGFVTPTHFQTQTKRKGTIGLKTWLVISDSGMSRLEEVGKHSIMRRTGLPARDLRALDPVLSYPSSILGRERAIVVNLEHIKAIITAKEILMLNSTNPLVVHFVQDLQQRILCVNVTQQEKESNVEMDDATCMWDASTLQHHIELATMPMNDSKDNISKTMMNMPEGAGQKALPFEFRALEACLESACRCLESETGTLEEEAYPALDELTSKISTLNLDRVRQIKSRLVAISGRVQKVSDELEHLLDDDNDMAEMYLTEKLADRSLDQASLKEELDNDPFELVDQREDDSGSLSSSVISTTMKPNIEELEMLLEAYFAQIDGVLQKLSDMSDYVDDTEDFINIMLDDKQNQLLQMGVLLSSANMIINAGIVVVGLFGMNIHIDLYDSTYDKFWETVGGVIGCCFALYVIAYSWAKKKKLLDFIE